MCAGTIFASNSSSAFVLAAIMNRAVGDGQPPDRPIAPWVDTAWPPVLVIASTTSAR